MANMTFKASLLPNTSLGYSLGSDDKQWNIYGELNGNASSADKLKTARTLTIGGIGKDFDGSIDISWSHAEIGATVSNTWTAGTTAGPTITTTVNGVAGTPVAIPSASASTSGIVTTGEQTLAGLKIFKNNNGAIMISKNEVTRGTIPSANSYGGLYLLDSTGQYAHSGGGRIAIVESYYTTDGKTCLSLATYPNTVGSTATNYIGIYSTQSGTCSYAVKDPAAFRTALGLGARATDNTAYLPLTGGTMTGALNTANGTWNIMGDDSQIGDINEAGTLGLQGKNGNTAIRFTTYNQSSKTTGGKITWDGNNFTFTNLTQSHMIFPYHEVTSFNANSATSGIYSCKCSVTNAPVTNHGVLIDFHFVGTPFQIFMPDNINYMYKRWYTSGAWTAWQIMNAAWA